MKKLLIPAAALALAVSAVPALVVQAQAAPAKSPYCNMAPAANQSWAEYYGCWGKPARAQPAMAAERPARARPAAYQTDYCKLAPAANASWAEYYHCWGPHR
jgi:hypothetical protein